MDNKSHSYNAVFVVLFKKIYSFVKELESLSISGRIKEALAAVDGW